VGGAALPCLPVNVRLTHEWSRTSACRRVGVRTTHEWSADGATILAGRALGARPRGPAGPFVRDMHEPALGLGHGVDAATTRALDASVGVRPASRARSRGSIQVARPTGGGLRVRPTLHRMRDLAVERPTRKGPGATDRARCNEPRTSAESRAFGGQSRRRVHGIEGAAAPSGAGIARMAPPGARDRANGGVGCKRSRRRRRAHEIAEAVPNGCDASRDPAPYRRRLAAGRRQRGQDAGASVGRPRQDAQRGRRNPPRARD
jgi:hypothetical protein